MNNPLYEAARKLRMSGLISSLEIRLQEAMSHGLSHAEFLELVLQDELAVRDDRRLQRRVKSAMFRELKTLENFDWSFNPSIKQKQVFELATCRFIREARDVLWLGPPGVGKSQGLRITIAKLGYMGSFVSRANPDFCRTVLRLSDSVVTNTAHCYLRNII